MWINPIRVIGSECPLRVPQGEGGKQTVPSGMASLALGSTVAALRMSV